VTNMIDNKELQNTLGQFMQSDQGKKFQAHKGEISALAASREGENVLKSLSGDKIKKAVQSGDAESIISEVSRVMQTPEGARFYEAIRKIVEK